MIHAFSGGVGGARLVVGLHRILAPGDLTVVVNTADDFDYLGLHIMPDLDSVLYALAGINDETRGWGRDGETWVCRDAIAALGGDAWFALGDKDIATHILRTQWLREGMGYADVAAALCKGLRIDCRVVPMSDSPVATVVRSEGMSLPFQEYFVRLQCAPRADGFHFDGADTAPPHPDWIDSLRGGNSKGVIFCPSNPFVSIGPILALPGVRDVLRDARVPVVAVSPIVGGQALKGPAAKMMREQGMELSPTGVARCYEGLLDGMVIDNADEVHAPALRAMGLKVVVTDTIMKNRIVSETLASSAIGLLDECAGRN